MAITCYFAQSQVGSSGIVGMSACVQSFDIHIDNIGGSSITSVRYVKHVAADLVTLLGTCISLAHAGRLIDVAHQTPGLPRGEGNERGRGGGGGVGPPGGHAAG